MRQKNKIIQSLFFIATDSMSGNIEMYEVVQEEIFKIAPFISQVKIGEILIQDLVILTGELIGKMTSGGLGIKSEPIADKQSVKETNDDPPPIANSSNVKLENNQISNVQHESNYVKQENISNSYFEPTVGTPKDNPTITTVPNETAVETNQTLGGIHTAPYGSFILNDTSRANSQMLPKKEVPFGLDMPEDDDLSSDGSDSDQDSDMEADNVLIKDHKYQSNPDTINPRMPQKFSDNINSNLHTINVQQAKNFAPVLKNNLNQELKDNRDRYDINNNKISSNYAPLQQIKNDESYGLEKYSDDMSDVSSSSSPEPDHTAISGEGFEFRPIGDISTLSQVNINGNTVTTSNNTANKNCYANSYPDNSVKLYNSEMQFIKQEAVHFDANNIQAQPNQKTEMQFIKQEAIKFEPNNIQVQPNQKTEMQFIKQEAIQFEPNNMQVQPNQKSDMQFIKQEAMQFEANNIQFQPNQNVQSGYPRAQMNNYDQMHHQAQAINNAMGNSHSLHQSNTFYNERQNIRPEEQKRMYSCPYCPSVTGERKDLEVHIRQEHNIVINHCQKCDYASTTLNELEQHIRSEHQKPKPFGCPREENGVRCDFRTSQKHRLGMHIKALHDKIKDYFCKYCDHSTSNQNRLMNHVKGIHDKILDFECASCEYSTSQNHRLKVHIKAIHQNIKEFKCPDCEFETAIKQRMKAHTKRVHDKIRDFKCGFCGRLFSQKVQMRKHEASVHMAPRYVQ